MKSNRKRPYPHRKQIQKRNQNHGNKKTQDCENTAEQENSDKIESIEHETTEETDKSVEKETSEEINESDKPEEEKKDGTAVILEKSDDSKKAESKNLRKSSNHKQADNIFITFQAIDTFLKAIQISPNNNSTEKLIKLLDIEKFEWNSLDQELINYLINCFRKINIDASEKSESCFVITKGEQSNYRRIASLFMIDDHQYLNYFHNSVWNLFYIKDGIITHSIKEISIKDIKDGAINIYTK